MLSELRRMNDAVFENQKDGDNSLKDSEPFKKQFAAVLLQLNEVNEQARITIDQLSDLICFPSYCMMQQLIIISLPSFQLVCYLTAISSYKLLLRPTESVIKLSQ